MMLCVQIINTFVKYEKSTQRILNDSSSSCMRRSEQSEATTTTTYTHANTKQESLCAQIRAKCVRNKQYSQVVHAG